MGIFKMTLFIIKLVVAIYLAYAFFTLIGLGLVLLGV